MQNRALALKTGLNLLFLILFILPVGMLFVYFSPPTFPVDFVKLLQFSLILAFLSTCLAFVLGVPGAFVAAEEGVFARFLNATVLIPFFLPANIVSTLIYQVYQQIFAWFGLDGRGNFWGLIWAHAFYETPIVIFYLSLALRTLPSAYFGLMYADGLPIFHQYALSLTLIRPQILQAAAIVFLYVFQSTAVMISLGLGRYQTLESAILVTANHRSNLSAALGLAIVQAAVLGVLFFLASRCGLLQFHYSLIRNRQERQLPALMFCRVWSMIFLLVIFYALSPLLLRAWQGVPQLKQVWQRFPIVQSLVNSSLASLGASAVALIFVVIWMFYCGGKKISYPMIISQAIYFIGLLLCGILWSISSWVLAIWGLAIALIPFIYFFLQSGQISEDQQILQAAQMDGARGWYLWRTMHWPLWRERWFVAFWKGVLVAFGNFPFAYILSQKRFAMAPAVLEQLLNLRYIQAANTFSSLVFILLLIPLLFFIRKKKAAV